MNRVALIPPISEVFAHVSLIGVNYLLSDSVTDNAYRQFHAFFVVVIPAIFKFLMLAWSALKIDNEPGELTKQSKMRIAIGIFGTIVYSIICIFVTSKEGFEFFIENKWYVVFPMYVFLAATGGEVWHRSAIEYDFLIHIAVPLHVGIFSALIHFFGRNVVVKYHGIWIAVIVQCLIDAFFIWKNGLKSLPLWIRIKQQLLEDRKLIKRATVE